MNKILSLKLTLSYKTDAVGVTRWNYAIV